MKAFREERNTMHTKRAGRWVSSVAVLTVAALGLGAPLAAPASAASETLSASPAQPRYPVGQTAVINVVATNPNAGDSLILSVVSGPDKNGTSASCTNLSATGGATCTLNNTGGAGTDQVVITDPGLGVSSPPTTVSFETLTATANQNVATAGTLYLYGAGQTATINATFAGAATTPALKALVTAGPDQGVLAPCTQSSSQPANWTCALTNNGDAGADTIQLFDDGSANGTLNQADTDEAKTSLTVNFEKLVASPVLPRVNTSPAGAAAFNVTLTGKPASWVANIKEVITNGQFSSKGACTPVPTGPTDVDTTPNAADTSFTCKIVNNGRADTVTVDIFDDLNNNGAASNTEPRDSATANFEVVTAEDANPGTHSAGTTATINVSVTGTPAGQTPSIDLVVPAAADPDTTTTSVICPPSGATTFTCSLKNTGGAGTDHVIVFDDANNDGVLTDGEPQATLNVAFGDSLTAKPRATAFPSKDANNPGSGVAPIDVTVTSDGSTAPAVRYHVNTGGPDADATGVSHPCDATSSASVWVCNVANSSAAAGTDNVQIFNANAAVPASATATVNVSFNKPASITLTPNLAPGQGQAQIAAGGCQAYTVTVPPGVKFPVRITATQALGSASSAPAATLSSCGVPGGSSAATNNAVTSSGGGGIPILSPPPTWTDTLTITGTTAQDPAHPTEFTVGISSNKTGSVSVRAATILAVTGNNVSTSSQTLNVVTPGIPSKASVTPTKATIAAGGTQAFTVLVQDSNSTPLPGAAVSYFVSGGPDQTVKAVACPTTDQLGTAKCSLTNNRSIGTDQITFFAPQATGETAPAANDPQATATLTVNALPPAGSHLTFGCPDQLLSNVNQIGPACTVSTGNGGSQSVIFAAHIADPGGAAVPDVPVTFTVANAPAGASTTATQVISNAKGNALFVVTVPNPASGNKITVQAVVGDPANGGLGPQTAVATFQAPHPAVVSVTPSSQRVSPGSLVNLTGRVTDQFGAGIAGHQLSWSVSGRNNDSGTVTTGANGAASFGYVDTGTSGGDSVSVLDISADAPSGPGSNNPASAAVTFGSGGGNGCPPDCNGGGTGQKEHPTLKVKQKAAKHHRAKLILIVKSHPKLVAANVTFYQVSKKGHRTKIGTGHTGKKGKVKGTLKAAKGLHLRFQAKVHGKAGVKSGFSKVVKVHVTG